MHHIEAIAERRCAHPFDMLGHHENAQTMSITVFAPTAKEVSVASLEGDVFCHLSAHGNGVFSGDCQNSAFIFPYKVLAKTDNTDFEYIDPYQFREEAYHAVHFIDHAPQNLYQQAGAQLVTTSSGVSGVRFAVFAPNASSVSVIGNFNYWNPSVHQMQKTDLGFWVLFIPGVQPGDEYKYALKDASGSQLPDKADPIGFHHHQYPSHASVVHDHASYLWHDTEWQTRTNIDHYRQPMSIYEVHLGSWKRPERESKYASYHELANDLVSYAVTMGYTHIEVLPVSEYPFDGSWGYQPVGLFAPTSRFGGPDDFKYFVDACHQAGIAVIIDWVPAHFPADGHGLARFDGTHVYEYEDPRKGWHPDWNSCIYDYGKDTVRQFLVANALFWFDKYHVDGIRVDAVASMLYLDYSRNDGEWVPNVHGGNHNLEAISLLQWMNTEVYKQFPNAVTIAEESTSFAGVSKPVETGGLGFGFKWNMGWMHDTLTYISKDPMYRRYHHGDLTFSMVYAYDENFILPISHDEVVHGKGSMLQKMPGDEWQKFANMRCYFSFMYTHPGKKLTFMGTEIGQGIEWNHDGQLSWELLSHANHQGIHALFKDLNKLYKTYPAMHQLDHQPAGFTWLDLHNADQSILAYVRYSNDPSNHLIVICNFTPIPHHDVTFGAPMDGEYRVIFNSDDKKYGGSHFELKHSASTAAKRWHEQDQSIVVNVPPLSVIIYQYQQV